MQVRVWDRPILGEFAEMTRKFAKISLNLLGEKGAIAIAFSPGQIKRFLRKVDDSVWWKTSTILRRATSMVSQTQRPIPVIAIALFGSAIALSSFVLPPHAVAQAQQTVEVSAEAVEKLQQGLELIRGGRIPEAIAAFREATRLAPNLAPAHYNLGLALRQKGELQASADAFYQATQADPNFALAYANLGAALLEGQNLDQAGDYLERAVELNPELGLAHYNLGLVREFQGRLADAIVAHKRAIAYSPNAPEPHFHLGKIYTQQGKTPEALDAFRKALTISPNYPEAQYSLGSLLLAQGQLEEALEAFRSLPKVTQTTLMPTTVPVWSFYNKANTKTPKRS